MKNAYRKLILFAFVLIVLSAFFTFNTIKANAYTTNIDVSKLQPIVIVEGESVSPKSLITQMKYNGSTITVKSFAAYINGTSIGSGTTSTTAMNTTSFGLTDTNPSAEGYIVISYINPNTGLQENATLPLTIIKNYMPVVNAPHIYVSSQQFDAFSKITNNNDASSLYNYIKNQITVDDADGTATTVNLYTYNGGTFSTSAFKKGQTTQICVTVTDLNKTMTVPCYITVLNDEEATINYKGEVRPISEKYFPYYLANIKSDADGNYYAKLENGIYYFVDTSNNFLLNANGDKYPVDACLKTVIQPSGTAGLYKVVPVSKWIRNGNCRALLTSCFTNTDSSKYISSWTFSADDIKIIQETIKDGNLDDNFYFNYYSNGYCQLGTRNPNETGRIEDAYTLGNGLKWYISGDTLYIVGDDITDASKSYAIPDYAPSIKISTLINSEGINSTKYTDTVYLFLSKNSYNPTINTPWKNENFSKVVLDDRITRIGSYAFYGCENITEPINIPNSCVSIGEGAFMNCVNMTGDLQTKHIYKIEPFAFANCEEMEGQLRLGENALAIIGDGAFYNCGFTSSLIVPSSVSKIGKFAFMNCKNFSGKLTLSSNIDSMGAYAFAGCANFDGDLKLPASLTEIAPFAFAGCEGLNGFLYFGNNITKIGNYAFYGCENITGDIQLPENLESIGVGAFKNCKSFTSTLYLNNKLTNIDVEAFMNCLNIKVINNDNSNENLVIGVRAFFVTSGSVATKITKQNINVNNNPQPTVVYSYNFLADGRYATAY